MKHLINWVGIPATYIDQAREFYSTILGGIQFRDIEINETNYTLFPFEDSFNKGTLVKRKSYKPSPDGITIYLDGGR